MQEILADLVPPLPRARDRKMAAAAELTLLEKSLGLSKGNKYSAQGERQVRSGGGAEGERWAGARPARPGEDPAGGRRRRVRLPPSPPHVSASPGLLLRPSLPEELGLNVPPAKLSSCRSGKARGSSESP